MNAIREPSGDHDGSVGVAPVWVSWRASPLRDSAIQISIDPPRSEANAIDRPSGDHAASVSTAASFVSRRGAAEPSTDISQRSPSAVNATRVPSGEIAGCVMPAARCGPATSNR